MNVLIIEDSDTMRNILKFNIEKWGFEIIGEAVDGKEGIRKYKELNPDLVILDMSMPNMNGIEWLEAKKKN